MTKTGWLVVGAIIIVLALGGWWYVSSSGTQASPMNTADTTQGVNTTQNPSQDQTSGTSAGDTSNASLNADLQNVDGQMQSANGAGTSASSFNDTPVTQTQ